MRLRSNTSRSNGDSSAVRPWKGWPSSDGSTRHCPRTPSITAGSPASPTSLWLARAHRPPGPGEPERAQPQLVAGAPRLVGRHTSTVGVHALGEVPQPVTPLAPAHGDLAAGHHHLQQPADVAVVVPPRGPPRLRAGVRQLARRLRTRRLAAGEDVAPARVVRGDPVAAAVPPVAAHRARPGRHVGEVQGDVLGRAHRHLQLDQHARGQRRAQPGRGVRRPQATPRHEVGARRHGLDMVHLQQREVPDDVLQVGGTVTIQQLRPYGDAARVLPGQLVDGRHDREPRSHERPAQAGPSSPAAARRIRTGRFAPPGMSGHPFPPSARKLSAWAPNFGVMTTRDSGHRTSALLVIDVQNANTAGAWQRGEVIDRIRRLIDRAKAAGAPVLWVQHEEGEPFTPGSDGWQIVEEVRPAEGETVLAKHYLDSFADTTLRKELTRRRRAPRDLRRRHRRLHPRHVGPGAGRGVRHTLVADAHTTDEGPWDLPLPDGRTVSVGAEVMVAYTNFFVADTVYPGITTAGQPRRGGVPGLTALRFAAGAGRARGAMAGHRRTQQDTAGLSCGPRSRAPRGRPAPAGTSSDPRRPRTSRRRRTGAGPASRAGRRAGSSPPRPPRAR